MSATSASEQLHAAIAEGDAARVRTLLEAEPGLAGTRDRSGVSAVARAAYMRRDELLALVLAADPPLDVFDAAIAGRGDRLRELLAEDPGAARAWSADGFTALHLAAFFGQPQALRTLLAAGADPNAAARNPMRVTPLHSAAARLDHDAVGQLLAAGAEVDARQAGGFTPLLAAAHAGDERLLRQLLDAGAEPGLRDDEGRDAADHLRAAGHDRLLPLLGAA